MWAATMGKKAKTGLQKDRQQKDYEAAAAAARSLKK